MNLKLLQSCLGLLLSFTLISDIFSQADPPEPCDDGTQASCTCETSPVLCTPEDLDGYQYSMTNFQHPWDGPSPLCSGAPNSVSNNPTWFAFVAWCEELDLIVQVENCSGGTSLGIQTALYGDCNYQEEIDCNVDVTDCGNENDKQLNLVDLEVGKVYYFLVDGCAGSACDVTIIVDGDCGIPEIEDWSNPIDGPDLVCIGDAATYSVDNLDGANTYHWYVDGVEIGTSEDPVFNIPWDEEGTFELCVDASNDPCIPVTDPPDQICMTVEVFAPEAGDIEAVPNPLCPGETTNITVTDYNDDNPDLELAIVIVNRDNVIEKVVYGDATDFTSEECTVFSAYAYQYIPDPGDPPLEEGDVFSVPNCESNCCDIAEEELIFEDTEDPSFLDPPGNESYSCVALVPDMEDLEFEDNCLPNGFVQGEEDGSSDLCDGGTITRTWTVEDSCGNIAEHTQTIDVDPIPIADWVAPPPSSVTVNCNSIPTSFDDLEYTNGASDPNCEISGIVSPTVDNTVGDCDGTITVTWEFTDACDRTIDYTQVITVEPPEEPAFIDPPANETVSCSENPTGNPPPELDFTNGQSGDCLISGTVIADVDGTADECGGTITYTWEFTDICMRTISHVQEIEVEPASEATFIDPPENVTLSCDALPLPTPDDLAYTNGESGDCEIAGTVAAETDGDPDECGGIVRYTWTFTDNCERTISHQQVITIEPAPEASFVDPPSNQDLLCSDLPLPPAPDLEYSNGASGDCGISGTVPASVSGSVDECGGSLTYTWEFTDNCERTISHSQTIDLEPAPEPQFIDPPGPITLSCDDAVNYDNPTLDYSNGASGDCEISGFVEGEQLGTIPECGGQISIEWEFTDQCGREISHSQTVNVEPASPPEFDDPPGDITVTCNQAEVLSPPNLSYSNGESGNCSISGTVPGSQSGSFNACGGALIQSWDFTDDCGNSISEERTVTVNPAPAPDWIDPPGNITITCEEVEDLSNSLSYSNGSSGQCLIESTVTGVLLGDYDECGGNLTQEWSTADICGNLLEHSRTITVTPAEDPEFVDPPDDITLDCGEEFPDPFSIEYTNDSDQPCEIAGDVLADVEINGLTATYTWTFEHPCTFEEISHIQTVTATPEPDISIEPTDALICEGASFDLTEIQVVDNNNTNFELSFHTNLPPATTNEIPNPENFTPQSSTVIYVVATTIDGGCISEAPFVITLETPPNAGPGGTGQVCDNESGVALENFLDPIYDQGGFWESEHSGTIDISNPNSVNFNGVDGGDYTFQYIVPGSQVCPPDTAELVVTVLERPTVEILSVQCTGSNDFYSVEFTISENAIFFINAGEDSQVNDSTYIVEEIPIGSNLFINAILGSGFCPRTFTVQPPDCDCPNVPPPSAAPPEVICEGDPIPQLMVDVNNGLSANWYDEENGGELVAENTTTFTPNVSDPGVYSYYVESYDLEDSCLSNTKVEVILEIRSLPMADSIEVSECGEEGFALFQLEDYYDSIVVAGNPDLTFHLSFQDAENGVNPIGLPFENSEPDSQRLFVRVVSSNSCFVVVPIDLMVVPNPNFSVEVENELCQNDSSGRIALIPENGSPPFDYFLEQMQLQDSVIVNLTSGDYIIGIEGQYGCSMTDTITILEGQWLDYEIVSIECDDNGTSSDSTDDRYTIELRVESNYTQNQFRLESSEVNLTGLDYGEVFQVEIDAINGDWVFSIIDEGTNCAIDGLVEDVFHCSSDCVIEFEHLEFQCDDNGTPSNPDDDEYTIRIVVEGINVASNEEFVLRLDNVIQGSYSYGDTILLNIPANGQTIELRATDSQTPACQVTEISSALNSCSDQCLITAEILERICNNQGTLNDEGDDTYQIIISVDGVNVGGSVWESSLGQEGSYGSPDTLGPYLISDGPFDLIFRDLDSSNCEFQLNVDPPPPCSDPCEIQANYTILECNNNGTGANPNDDYFDLELTVDSLVGPTTRFTVEDENGNSWGPFDYGETIVISPLPADGNSINLTIRDDIATQCITEITVSSASCSECNVNLQVGPDQILTCDNNEVEIYATAPGALGISWMGPQGFTANGDTVSVDAAGWYIVQAEFEDSCFISDSVRVELDNNIPEAVGGPDGVINCQQDSFLVQNLSGNQSDNVIVEWRDGDGNFITNEDEFFVSDSGTFELRLIDTVSQCTSAIERVRVEINFRVPNPEIFAEPDSVFDCLVRTIELSTNPESHTVYRWMTSEVTLNGPSVTVFNAGTVILIAIDTLSTCADTSSIDLDEFDDFPSIEIEDPDLLTCRDTVVLLDASESFFGPNIEYQWLDSNGDLLASDTSQLLVNEPGWYYFQSRDESNNCLNQDSTFVNQNRESLTGEIEGDLSLPCGEISGRLNLNVLDSLEPATTQWSTTEGLITSPQDVSEIEFEGGGTYQVEFVHPISFCVSQLATNVQASGELTIESIDIDSIFCQGDEGRLRVTDIQGSPPFRIEFEGKNYSLNEWIGPIDPGNYDLSVVDANECTADTSISFQEGRNIQIDLIPSLFVEMGEIVTVEAEVNIPEEDIESALWAPTEQLSCFDCLTTTITAISEEEYLLTVTDEDGCIGTASFRLLLRPGKTNIFIPNVFTPNGDNVNDQFTLYTDADLTIDEFEIFDRWGNRVFQNKDLLPNIEEEGWDGTFKNRYVENGVYVYVFRVTFSDGRKEVYHGDITVNR